MNTVIAGGLGDGKTLYALEIMEQMVARGRIVLTNIELTPRCPFYDRVVSIGRVGDEIPVLEEIETLGRRGRSKEEIPYRAFWHYIARVPGCVVVIDEADMWFDCTDHSKLGRDLRAYLKMARKLKHDLYFIVQHVSNLYVRIRRLSHQFVVCWNKGSRDWLFREGWLPRKWAPFERAAYPSEDIVPGTEIAYGRISYEEAKVMFGWYRTDQLVGDTSWMVGHDSIVGGVAGEIAGQTGGDGRTDRATPGVALVDVGGGGGAGGVGRVDG